MPACACSSRDRAARQWNASCTRCAMATVAMEARAMLLELAEWLRGQVSVFHLFQYVTFRTIMSALTALVFALLLGPDVIRRLAAVKAGQVIRSDGPQTHLA